MFSSMANLVQLWLGHLALALKIVRYLPVVVFDACEIMSCSCHFKLIMDHCQTHVMDVGFKLP